MKDNVRFDLSYNRRDADTSEDIISFNLSFENPKSSEDVAAKLQTFLNAVGYDNIFVEVQTAREEERYLDPDDDIPF